MGLRSDLAPCPFCGSRNTLEVVGVPSSDNIRGYAVKCLTCWCHGPEHDTRVEAMAGWDKRLSETP